jgi:hypothetical protein
MIHWFTQLNVNIQTSNNQTKCFWVGWMEEHPVVTLMITHYALDEEFLKNLLNFSMLYLKGVL